MASETGAGPGPFFRPETPHEHRFTVAVEWEAIDWPNPSSQYIKFAKGQRVTRLRCESCDAEVSRDAR